MATIKGLTATGETILQSNMGIEVSYLSISETRYSATAITAAEITYDDLAALATASGPGTANIYPLGSLPVFEELLVPDANNPDIILNKLFRFRDADIAGSISYTARALYLMYHDPADLNDFDDDVCVAIATVDDDADDIDIKGANTIITFNIALMYDNNNGTGLC